MEEEGEDGGRWGKWRKRITRVFTGGKEKEKEKGREGNKGSVEELPRIVVSSPEEVAVERRENDAMRGEEEVLKEVAKVGKEDMLAKAKEDQLAKAHQDVIAQMREAMLEARGGTKVGTGGERERWDAQRLEREAAAKAKEQQKPPVPPTKEEMLRGGAKRGEDSDWNDQTKAGNQQQAMRPPRQKVNALGNSNARESDTLIIETKRMAKKSEGVLKCDSDFEGGVKKTESDVTSGDCEESRKKEEEEELRAAKAAAARAKLRAALGIGVNAAKKQDGVESVEGGEKTQTSTGGVVKRSESGAGGEFLDDPGKAERIAATKAKMREALLSAAMAEVGRGGGKRSLSMKEAGGGGRIAAGKVVEQGGGGGLERRASTGRRLSTQAAGPGPTGGRRSSGVVETQNTIWAFFEEGRKKGTCKTCGYVVGIKHNHGGLTRHLSLVHQREYREYTARMEKNWTHGMMEKHLNIAVPKNI